MLKELLMLWTAQLKGTGLFFKFIIRYAFKTSATIKHVYDITSPDLLPISFIWMIQCKKSNVHYIGDTKRHLSDRFGVHRRTIEKAITQRHIYQPTAVQITSSFLSILSWTTWNSFLSNSSPQMATLFASQEKLDFWFPRARHLNFLG